MIILLFDILSLTEEFNNLWAGVMIIIILGTIIIYILYSYLLTVVIVQL